MSNDAKPGQALEPCRALVVAECEVAGASVSVVEYQWSDKPFIFEAQDYNLQYRLLPYQLDLSGHWGDGDDVEFGQMTLLPPGAKLQISPSGKETMARVLVCRMRDHHLTDLLEEVMERCTDNLQTLVMDDAEVRRSLHKIAFEVMQPRMASSLLVEGYLQVAVAGIVRILRGLATFDAAEQAGGRLHDIELRKLESIIAHADVIPSAQDLADQFGISASHLRRKFRATTGQTVHEFIMHRKIEQAQNLLANSVHSIKEITYRLGFSSPSAFSIAFNRICGLSPTQFRQNSKSCS